MLTKDSPSTPELEAYYLLTVMEDRAESARPPVPAAANDEETER